MLKIMQISRFISIGRAGHRTRLLDLMADTAGDEPLGLEPFDELRVSSSVEKLGAERLSRVVIGPTSIKRNFVSVF
jgi:hypothetical protein